MPVRRHPVAVSTTHNSLAALPLDLALVGRLRASYELVRAKQLRLAEAFYAKLFLAAPQLRALFRGDQQAQAEKLMAALDAVVRNFESPAQNAAMLAELGKRHAGYGTKPEHYDLVIDLLVESMEELLEPVPNARVLEEWRMALRLVSNQMIAGTQ